MAEIIYMKNSSYSLYEDLLLRRDKIKKEAFEYDRDYIRVFGDKLLKIFEIKISCIRLKKEINYCQTILNHGGVLNQFELEEYLIRELKEYQEQLDRMILDNESAKKSQLVSEIDLLEIRKVYRTLAKQIHPDINPKTATTPDLQDLWNRIVIAYECNDLKLIKELEVQAYALLESMGDTKIEIIIPNIQEKIAELEEEIVKIKTSDPYMYKFILEDNHAVNEKNKELDEEYHTYEDYEQQLEEVLENIKGEL